jgi:hypothetical protein
MFWVVVFIRCNSILSKRGVFQFRFNAKRKKQLTIREEKEKLL